jgi:5-methylcytosine-specific restriction protein A
MESGNRAIRDHAIAGKDLLVFRATGKRKPYTFVDAFSCAGWDYVTQPDRNGAMRQAIVFTLVPINSINAKDEAAVDAGEEAVTADLLTLRGKAFAAAAPTPATGTQKPRTVFERSADVRRYVLARAAGQCEGCGTPAPFLTAAGEPYLEAHHIRRLTDGGPDDPRFVAGICPNCHRRAHYGSDRSALNKALLSTVAAKEVALG